jgi:hypothetical protein
MKAARGARLGLVVAMTVFVAGGCGDDDDSASAEGGTEDVRAEPDPPPALDFAAKDYGFDLPATFEGGLLTMNMANKGKEPHFAAFAKPAEGKTTADIRAALSAPPGSAPAGPPPFEDVAGVGTIDPGLTSNLTVNLPTGSYVVYCAVPAPDGAPHFAKGMMVDIEVTEGSVRSLPETSAEVKVADFAIGKLPEFKPGKNTVTIVNNGKQLHELNLIELLKGKTVEDMVAWAAKEEGPPPAPFLGGPVVKQGLSGSTTFDLEAGKTYAIVCTIPDFLGDFAPHITKGMHSPPFEVTAGSG